MVGQALDGGRPWWQACCLGCGIFVFALAVAAAWFAHGIKGPGIQYLRTLPPNFPSNIELYRIEQAKSIGYVPAVQKIGIAERILSPLQLLGIIATSTDQTQASNGIQSVMQHFSTSTPATSTEPLLQVFNADTLLIDWGPMTDVRASDIMDRYRTLLERDGFQTDVEHDDLAQTDTIFGERSDATVQVDVKESSSGTGIDEMRAVVNYVGQ